VSLLSPAKVINFNEQDGYRANPILVGAPVWLRRSERRHERRAFTEIAYVSIRVRHEYFYIVGIIVAR
jgi:hypothetical protein